MADSGPVGIFDSGVGGLSVLKEIREMLPHEDILYLADTANCPYGSKTREQIRRLASGIARFLISQGAKLIVVACNTASVASLAHLRAEFAIPFVGMVPAVKPAASSSRSRRVGVMATSATFQGEMFDDLVRKFASDVEIVRQVCPGLVQVVEKGQVDSPETDQMLADYVRPLIEAQVDTIVLGCTHYVFLRRAVQNLVGPDVAVIDSGQAVARQVTRVLEDNALVNAKGDVGKTLYFTTGDAQQVATVITRLTGDTTPLVRSVSLPLSET